MYAHDSSNRVPSLWPQQQQYQTEAQMASMYGASSAAAAAAASAPFSSYAPVSIDALMQLSAPASSMQQQQQQQPSPKEPIVMHQLSYELRHLRPECTQVCEYTSTDPHALPTDEQIRPGKIRLVWEYLRAYMCDYARMARDPLPQQKLNPLFSPRFPPNDFPTRTFVYDNAFEIEQRLAKAFFTRTCPCTFDDNEVCERTGALECGDEIDMLVAWSMEQHLEVCVGGKTTKKAAKLAAVSAAVASSMPVYDAPEPCREFDLPRNLWQWAAWRM
jgi:hypothetical protein